MLRQFFKLHGAGNDYIYFDCLGRLGSVDAEPDPLLTSVDINSLAQRLSDRHFSIGGDGIILICPSEIADARMRMFNSDGSEGEMCGNAIRCVGKLVYEKLLRETGLKKPILTIETKAGVKRLMLDIKGSLVIGAVVGMGKADFTPSAISALSSAPIIDSPIDAAGRSWRVTALSMGNPHCVVFVSDIESLDLPVIGPKFENMPLFPQKINTEFARIVSPYEIEMRVWERGSGETLACGTGASATAAAAVKLGFCAHNFPIAIKLKGGTLFITVKDDFDIIMKGPCESAFYGFVEI
ncbi:Diaminopimelate epimerase [bioreactor metagenome]|uniref:diaminopimelate epimerase n=1 Tax=bioreactor metagenome TaxID=1076179 RepID=A0A645AGA3_9ZZZZ|nr:diaminopimelate epimerase [Oscillospiraceae bacterium]